MITSWKQMSIGTFMKVSEINRSQDSDEDKLFRIAALLSGMEYEDFLNLPLNESRGIIAKGGFMYEEPKAGKIKKTYVIGSRTYRVMRNMDDMTTAQYLNYQSIADKPVDDTMADLMAIVLIPEGKTYGDYDMTEITEEIRDNFNIEDALSVADFFTRLFERSIRRMQRYSDILLTAMEWKVRMECKNKEQRETVKMAMQLVRDELHSMYGYPSSKR